MGRNARTTAHGPIIFEACVDSVDAAVAAQEGGADRVELCADLLEGGCTPSAGVVRLARARLAIGLHVIIRPRGGDFCYSANEFEAMEMDVQFAREAGADGVVVGVLREDGTVDTERTGELVRRARPMAVTFHRAFDMTVDPFAALEALEALGIERVLTSGQEATAFEGADLIADLVARGAGRIIVMPGGGITERNAAKILKRTGATEVHAAVISSVEGRMRFRNTRCHMGGELRPPEFALSVTEPGGIRGLRAALG
jgi:copper homeostasis protein